MRRNSGHSMPPPPSPSARTSSLDRSSGLMAMPKLTKTCRNSSLSSVPFASLSIEQNCRRRVASLISTLLPLKTVLMCNKKSCHFKQMSNMPLNSSHSIVPLPLSSATLTSLLICSAVRLRPIFEKTTLSSSWSSRPSWLVSIFLNWYSNDLSQNTESSEVPKIASATSTMMLCHSMLLFLPSTETNLADVLLAGPGSSAGAALRRGRVIRATVLITWNILRNSSHSMVPLSSLSATTIICLTRSSSTWIFKRRNKATSSSKVRDPFPSESIKWKPSFSLASSTGPRTWPTFLPMRLKASDNWTPNFTTLENSGHSIEPLPSKSARDIRLAILYGLTLMPRWSKTSLSSLKSSDPSPFASMASNSCRRTASSTTASLWPGARASPNGAPILARRPCHSASKGRLPYLVLRFMAACFARAMICSASSGASSSSYE
mmetsp:Transcript_97220/g.296984  ORF Transcript_97220/g.296984 Transcript_97220/m.296984 type:complete len:434 (-) Transcript_97220:337-1638(-)